MTWAEILFGCVVSATCLLFARWAYRDGSPPPPVMLVVAFLSGAFLVFSVITHDRRPSADAPKEDIVVAHLTEPGSDTLKVLSATDREESFMLAVRDLDIVRTIWRVAPLTSITDIGGGVTIACGKSSDGKVRCGYSSVASGLHVGDTAHIRFGDVALWFNDRGVGPRAVGTWVITEPEAKLLAEKGGFMIQ